MVSPGVFRNAVAIAGAMVCLAGCGGSPSSTPSTPASVASAVPTPEGLMFSGGLTGRTDIPHATGDGLFCDGASAGATVLDVEFAASLGGTTYTFSIHVDPYAGPKAYPLGLNGSGSFTFGKPVAGPDGVITTTAAYSAVGGTVTIGPTGVSGDVDADLTAGDTITTESTPSAHVKGHWSCR